MYDGSSAYIKTAELFNDIKKYVISKDYAAAESIIKKQLETSYLDRWSKAYLHYNLAVIRNNNSDYNGYYTNLEFVKRILEQDSKENTAFYAQVLEDLGKLKTGTAGNPLLLEAAYRRALLNISREGGPELTYVPFLTDYYTSSYMNYFFSLYNKKYMYDFTNYSLTCRGKVTEAEKSFFMTYYPYFSKNIMALAEKSNTAYYDRINYFLFPRPETDAYQKNTWSSFEEERLLQFIIEKYQYSFSTSPQVIKSRTVEGRLFDVNIFLSSAINHRKASELTNMPRMVELNIFNRNELQGIDAYCADKNSEILNAIDISLYDYYMENKIIFVDVGPALANEKTSATTTLELSKDFPLVSFVALDLPEQVSIFNSPMFVNENKKKILASPNIYILSGDGTQSISLQLYLARNGENKSLTRSDGDLIILRCANSLDVYIPWEKNREYLEQAAFDFIGHPLLVFHNKVILYKPRASQKYKFIGLLSDAGFDHLREAIVHNGQMPFTLFPVQKK